MSDIETNSPIQGRTGACVLDDFQVLVEVGVTEYRQG